MRHWATALTVASLLALAGCNRAESEPDLKPDPKPAPIVKEIEPNFESRRGGFKIWLPGKPEEKGDAWEWSDPDGKGLILIVESKLKIPRDPRTDASNLKELVRLHCPEKYKQRQQSVIHVGDDVGLEVRGEEGEDRFIFRVILVGEDRNFQITVHGDPAFVASKEVRDALESFRSVK
jgi:hypothetical protein